MIYPDQIHLALQNSEFYLEYMPTFSLKDNACCGAEALIRWKPNGKEITPLEYIPMIENTPFSGTLTYWVIEEVGREMQTWLKSNNRAHIAINIPPEIIGRVGIKFAAERAGLMDVGHKIIFEITERGFPDDIALQSLNQPEFPGRIAIDDYGAGDANLMQLSQMNANIIKIDKKFIDQIKKGQEFPKIIKGLVAFATVMEVEIIAEGIETKFQMDSLKELGVQMAQGWFFSKPLRAEAFKVFFQDN